MTTMSRVDHVRIAVNHLAAALYDVGNDHPGYEHMRELLNEVHGLEELFKGGPMTTETMCGLQWTTEDPADTGVHVCMHPRAHDERLHLCRCGNQCGA